MRLCLFLLFTICPLSFYAVDPKITIEINPLSIGTNERAEIRVSIINQKTQDIPRLSINSGEFSLEYAGTSTQRQMTFINGSMNIQNIQSFIFRLIPKAIGEITIPSFIITLDNGKEVYTDSSKINVEAIDVLNAPRHRGGGQMGFNPFNFFSDGAGDIFLQWRVTRDRLVQNTGFIAYLYVFVENPNFLDNNPTFNQEYRPRHNGMIIYSMGAPETNDIVVEQFGYQTMYGKILQQYIVFPLEKGDLFLVPPVLTYDTRGIQAGTVVGDPIQITSMPITDNLTYIGNEVSMVVDFPKDNLGVSEEIEVTLTIEGDGNVDFFTNPFQNVSLSNLFITEPTSSLDLGFESSEDSNQIYMKKTFVYTMIPREAGVYNIPSVILNYTTPDGYNTNAKLSSISFDVVDSNKQDREFSYPLLPVKEQLFSYKSGLNYMLVGILLGIFLMLFAKIKVDREYKLSTDVNYARSTGAKKRLHRIMANSEQAIKNNQYKEAARLIRQSVLYFCADKFSISNSSSAQEIISFLDEKNVHFPSKSGFLSFMADLDFYSFASTPSEVQIKSYLSDAYTFLNDLDKIKLQKEL